ncbi:hypothetical protein FIBSPDRAFT_802992 [Athelia psychrophila]|uniref:MYND-type domain-containing protein n=1 Tax=Athelia psychrophila TaxID=1759441 RepID=A0A165XDA3_9AGAM|nr:hypothetical protein FIBSPDRAFT_802992 [Fibularhizoctonia sp. CBS 109695]
MPGQKCAGCMEPSTRRCSGCKDRSAWYCSERCQRKSWPVHIFDCNPTKPINTAYHIARAAILDQPPFYLEAEQDYGFSKATSAEDKAMLLGLYKILLGQLEVEPKILHSWRTRGDLVEKIKVSFEAVPSTTRLPPFLWFLENQSVLGRVPSTTALEHSRPSLLPWRYLVDDISADPTDAEITAIRRGWPDDMKTCYELCTATLSQLNPMPGMDSWMYFGFCTCRDDEEAVRLGRIYRAVIENCKFGGLLAAYRASSLSTLMEKGGLRAMRESLPHLQHVLSCTGSGKLKSVWWLKLFVFVESDKIPESIPLLAIAAYGFVNCEKPQEREDLRGLYRLFFESGKGDPIALHNAAMAGQIFEYLGAYMQLKTMFRRLMKLKNPRIIESLR